MDAVMERISELLSPDELRDLTDSKPWAKQAAWLTERHIPHQVDGRRVLVSRVHVRAWLEGRHIIATTSSGPNFSAIR